MLARLQRKLASVATFSHPASLCYAGREKAIISKGFAFSRPKDGSDYLTCQVLLANFSRVSLALALSLTRSLCARAMRMTILGLP